MDCVPETRTAMALKYLEGLLQDAREDLPGAPSLSVDDRGELSAEAVRAMEEGRADHEAGRTYTTEEVKRELGL